MIKFFRYKWLFMILMAVMILSCKKSTKAPDVSNINVKVKILRFEQDLFNADIDHLTDSIPFFKKKYGEFFDMFNHKIINIGGTENPAYPEYLKSFMTDFDINKLKDVTDSVFKDFTGIENQINDVFKYYKYYFPQKPVPVVITYISGFNQSMVSSDSLLGISLDKYLGRDNPLYARLGLANFMKQNMFPAKIPSDCARAWAMTQFEMNPEQSTLLDNMLYQGKIIYFTRAMMPFAEDSLVIGLSNKQLEWCKENESAMWSYLVENKLLFNTQYQTILKFVGEAPFTKDFGRNSPGKAACWIGYKIIQQFMEKNSDMTLNKMMAESDAQKILRESKYKP